MTDTTTMPSEKQWFGHPRGLSTLFFTEMWERFSYYGMRAILILFMTAPIAVGGLQFDVAKAGVIYGTYTALVYTLEPVIATGMSFLLTGDRLLPLQWAGGALIIAGSLLPVLRHLRQRALPTG